MLNKAEFKAKYDNEIKESKEFNEEEKIEVITLIDDFAEYVGFAWLNRTKQYVNKAFHQKDLNYLSVVSDSIVCFIAEFIVADNKYSAYFKKKTQIADIVMNALL